MTLFCLGIAFCGALELILLAIDSRYDYRDDEPFIGEEG
jgi:hypothetical protein